MITRNSQRKVGVCILITLLFIVLAPAAALAQKGVSGAFYFDDEEVIAGLTTTGRVSLYKQTATIPSTGVEVTIALPAGFSLTNSTGDCTQSEVSPGEYEVTCTVGAMSAGQSYVSVLALDTEPDTIIELGGSGPLVTGIGGIISQDGEPDVDLAASSILVNEKVDLYIESYSSTMNLQVGDNFTYTTVVTNFGPSTARNVVIYDYIATEGASGDERVTINANGCSLAVRTEGGLIDEFDCNFAASSGVFDLATFGSNWLNPVSSEYYGAAPGTIEQGKIVTTMNLVVESINDADEAVLNNVARTVSESYDVDNSNNSAHTRVLAEGSADLSITKSFVAELQDPGTEALPYDALNPEPFPAPGFSTSSTAVTAGRRIRYTLTVENNGPSRAHNVVVVDGLPAGVQILPGTLVVNSPSGGGCLYGTAGNPNDKMVCGLGTFGEPDSDYDGLPSTGTIEFDVVVDHTFTSGTLLTNSVRVEAITTDEDNSGNYDSVISVVGPLQGVSGCSVGGPYQSVACGTGSASIQLAGYGFALPEAGPLTYNWSTDCPDGVLSDSSVPEPTLDFTTANPDETPVSCSVTLNVENTYANSTCTGTVNVVGCTFDCNGDVGGTAELDRCGVCEGDGNSCLGCESYDVAEEVASLDDIHRDIRRLIMRGARYFERNYPEQRRVLRLIRARALQLVHDAAVANEDLPVTGEVCSNTTFCTSLSLASTLTETGETAEELEALLQSIVTRYRRVSGQRRAGKAFLQMTSDLVDESNTAVAAIPLEASQCTAP